MHRFRPSWQGFVDNALFYVLLLLLAAGGSVALAIEGSDARPVLLAALWIVAMILLVVAPILWKRFGAVAPPERSRTNEEWRSQITQWLSFNRQFSLEKSSLEGDQLLMVLTKDNVTLQLIKPMGWQQFEIHASVAPGEEHATALQKASEEIRRELFEELVINLCLLGPDIQIEADQYHIKRVRYASVVPATPDLTEFQLLGAMSIVQRASGLVSNLIARYARLAGQRANPS